MPTDTTTQPVLDSAAVLIVDDDPGVATLQSRTLRRLGYETAIAHTAQQAMDLAASRPFDLMVLDYNLGEQDGIELCSRMRAAGHALPAVLVTGFTDQETAIRALRAGVRDFVTKTPQYLDYLPQAVERVMHEVRMEQRLRHSESRLQSIINTALDAIIVVDSNESITLFNPAAERLFGLRASDAIGLSLRRLQPAGVPEVTTEPLEVDWKRADGKNVLLEQTVSSYGDGSARCHTIMLRDNSVRRSLESQLRQAQKIEALGQLAGGVSHDFNNVLTAILGYAGLMQSGMDPADPNYEFLNEILTAGERASTLTRQLLTFSRKQIIEPRAVVVNEVISGIERMLRRLIGEDIDLRLDLQSRDDVIRADPGQIEQVLMNLVVNARDALPQGGMIGIETQLVILDEHYASQHIEVAPGQYVVIAVSDNGHGMDEETRQHIFEPFFTTKPRDKGTGLGLSTVYGIVKSYGGTINVYSERGQGTTFKLFFPRLTAGEVRAPEEQKSAPDRDRRGRILLVEDEDAVRNFVSLGLRRQGYEVETACNGYEALRLFADRGRQFDVLLTDTIMPAMSGRELAEQLQQGQPGLKVVYMSGYTDDAVLRHGVLPEGVHFIQKPFSARDLAQKVDEALMGEGPDEPLP
jgi:PAS domain S-box-containing protein